MSYPQQPSGASGETVQPSPPPEFSPQPSPPPVTAPQALHYPSGPAGPPPGRPAGIVIGGIGMFAIGLGYLVSAIVAGISAFAMGFHPGMLAMLATTVGQHLSTGSTTLAEVATDLRFLPGLMMVLLNLLVAVAAFAGGALVLMSKPVGRVLSLVIAGGAILMTCGSGVNSITMLALGGGPVWFSLILLLVNLGLFVAAVAVVAVLAPRRVEEWMRQSGQTTPVAAPAMTAVPTQPVGYVPVQQAPAPQPSVAPPPPGQPPMDNQPPQAPPPA
ncbi:hypothetical protein FB566_2942 [Stackebrandtia endophytica]|uniref:Uncharacterized protein n=1 Tax=Stackebrandtia endophytica TaxID=1496996 RepID=A0A543AXV6_9ACTN|nr:hypothetical protein [Stackebrandtia endophytica]TQL77383.1 hypothetical protein FB566_2942 [Stackebrandtia endophytica]